MLPNSRWSALMDPVEVGDPGRRGKTSGVGDEGSCLGHRAWLS